ncbi:hypothetical protein [Streptococcus ferus]|uniref:hypothetical protein n=1 Tax=Streptococcus ferus TaxID=1345 RepID=UPI0035A1BF23
MEPKTLQERVDDLEKAVYFKKEKRLATKLGEFIGILIILIITLVLITAIIGFAILVWNVFQAWLIG